MVENTDRTDFTEHPFASNNGYPRRRSSRSSLFDSHQRACPGCYFKEAACHIVMRRRASRRLSTVKAASVVAAPSLRFLVAYGSPCDGSNRHEVCISFSHSPPVVTGFSNADLPNLCRACVKCPAAVHCNHVNEKARRNSRSTHTFKSNHAWRIAGLPRRNLSMPVVMNVSMLQKSATEERRCSLNDAKYT